MALLCVGVAQGTKVFNYNLDSSESTQNPHRADSSLWYRVTLPDDRTGYISEIYPVSEDREGKATSL